MNSEHHVEFRLLRDEFHMIRERALIEIKNHTILQGIWSHLIENDAEMEIEFERLGPEDGLYLSHQPSPSYQDTPISTESGKTPQPSPSMENVLYDTHNSNSVPKGPSPSSISESPESGLIHCPTPETIPCHKTEAKSKPRPRKGHKKSRHGCFSCKSRKIKCQETQPRCWNCIRNKIKCIYPVPKTLVGVQQSAAYAPSPISSVNLQSTPVKFTLTDMRIFQHFLQEAYPYLPVGAASCWTSLVPLIAHHNEYVMHAILALAASHLGLITGEDLGTIAMHHRQLAIRGSNEAISQAPRTGSTGDALLASCYLIAFQSTYMPDGMEETFRMFRGCTMLNHQLKLEKLPMGFFCVDHFEYMLENLSNVPLIDPSLVTDSQKSLASLLPIIKNPEEIMFHTHLVEIGDLLAVSSVQAYFKFLGVYQWIISMSNTKLREFTAPQNTVSRILLINFLAIQLIMGPILNREFGDRRCVVTLRGHLDWIKTGLQILPADMLHFIEWPIRVAQAESGICTIK